MFAVGELLFDKINNRRSIVESDYNKVYGGQGRYKLDATKNSMEYYVIEKNEWFTLPMTQYEYGHSPSIWLGDHNVLYIAGSKSMEYIDLRENKAKWRGIENSLIEKFGIKDKNVSGYRQWLFPL